MSKTKKPMCIAISVVIACILSVFICSCSSHSEGASFVSSLDSIDALISQGDASFAFKSLKKLEKKAWTSYEYLGIYKRYFLLGEILPAEKILKKGLKKLPNDLELSAVYANFLLRQNRLEDAFKISLCLKDSQYSFIYAECILRKALLAIGNGESILETAFVPAKKKKNKKNQAKPIESIREAFCTQEFIPIYESAFKGSEDSIWIFNAASILMKAGEYKAAAQLYPNKVKSNKESFFWGCILFDAGLYPECIDVLEASSRLASIVNEENSYSNKTEISTLKADAYYIVGEDKHSEEIRLELIDSNASVSPLIYMNSAMFEKHNNNQEKQYLRLKFLVDNYPSFVPGFAGYGEFSLEQLKAPKEDLLTQKIRKAGLKTLNMEKQDKIPIIPFENIIEEITLLAEQNNSSEFLVLKDALEAEKAKITKVERPLASVWSLLEKINSSQNLYSSEIVHYAVIYLLTEGLVDDAQKIFYDYIKAKYDFVIEDNLEEIELWECELFAWFASKKADFATGMKCYNFIIEKYGERITLLNSAEMNASVVNAYVNLSVLYASTDRSQDALNILTKASAKSIDSKNKAEILFRIAELNWNLGDTREASRSLKYALSLNPEHNKARLLQKKIKAGM